MTAAEIAQLMAEITGTDEIGVDDDFFHMGGKSWGAIVLMAQLEERSGAKISLLEVFHTRTPSRLAELIAQRSVAER
jgi:acyl carrier protein